MFDLSSVAKGFAVDILSQTLSEMGLRITLLRLVVSLRVSDLNQEEKLGQLGWNTLMPIAEYSTL